MIQYKLSNVPLCNLRLNELKSRMKYGTEVTFKLFIKRFW